MRLVVLSAIALAAATSATPSVADPLEDAVKARRGVMQGVKLHFGGLVGMAKGEIAYDADVAKTHAANLALLAALDHTPMYPAGSAKADLAGKTRALASIWEKSADYTATDAKFAAATKAAAEAVGGGLDAVRAEVGKIGQSCKSCHDDYRAKDF